MILTPVNDPDRNPPHWSTLIRPGQFAVFVFDARSRQSLEPDGSIPPPGNVHLAPCNDLAEAKVFAKRLITEHPELCCEIYDQEAEYGQPLSTVYDLVFYDKHLGRGPAKRKTFCGSAALLAGSILVVIDFKHDLVWLWGYIIGLKCLVVGTALLINGLSGFYAANANWRTSREPTPRPAIHP